MDSAQQQLDALPAKKFQRIGGELCLDFCNTMGGKREGIPRENLHSYLHFLAWCAQAGLVNEGQCENLMTKAKHDSITAATVVSRAIKLREAIYRIFLNSTTDTKPEGRDISVLNAELAQSVGRLRVSSRREGKGFAWIWPEQPLDLSSPLGPLAYSAATILISEDLLSDLHQCCGDNCGWLFLDSSKNHSRRWCDMRDCGNRAKVRRHRQKKAG